MPTITVASLASVELNRSRTTSKWADVWTVLGPLAYDQCIVVEDEGRPPKRIASSLWSFLKRRLKSADFEVTIRIDTRGRVVIHKRLPDPEPAPSKKKTA